MLYQGLEKLEKEKANREHLEMEIDVVGARPQGPRCVPGQSRRLFFERLSGGKLARGVWALRNLPGVRG